MYLRHVLPVFKVSGLVCYLYQRLLERIVQRNIALEHVAIIQDGNRRYARQNGLSKFTGHSMGAETTDKIVDWCLDLGIKHLTIYTFSTENFKRDKEEKKYLFDLMRRKFLELCDSERIHRNRVRVRAIGRIDLLPRCLREAIKKLEEVTCEYDNMYFNVALAYGGQCELVDAARNIAIQVKDGNLKPEEVDENMICQHLYPSDDIPIPKVELIIRTGGEVRTSNFLPWQANGNECAVYFCAPYWPEFGKMDFLRAIRIAQVKKISEPAPTRLNYD
ncbi:MAG: polyprenyl diphosphate synthase [Methanotrichaceae archaeon]